jgi:hypothetical protein
MVMTPHAVPFPETRGDVVDFKPVVFTPPCQQGARPHEVLPVGAQIGQFFTPAACNATVTVTE